MGTNLSSVLETDEISIKDLKGKELAVDSYNLLYQFLTTIRQRDGTPLMDADGNITSHLSGLFFRSLRLMESGIKLAFVFDGKAPDLKERERTRRKQQKQEAKRKYDLAVQEGDTESMKKYASRTTKLTADMVDEAQELITALGMPVIHAPSEGEAQASFMVRRGDLFAVLSQDTDSLLFGASRIIKNLSVTRRRKVNSAYRTVSPEIVNLAENLNKMHIDREQLIVLAMLCGTDYNVGGVKGIGPKKGLKLLHKHKKDFQALFKETGWEFEYSWRTVLDTFMTMPVTEEYTLRWDRLDQRKVADIMVQKHGFTKDRILNALDKISKEQSQTGLSQFFS